MTPLSHVPEMGQYLLYSEQKQVYLSTKNKVGSDIVYDG